MAVIDLVLASLFICGGLGGLFYALRGEKVAPSYKGIWEIQNRSEDLDLQSYLAVYCVRMDQGCETARSLIGHVADDSPDWGAEYLTLMTQAEERLLFLNNPKGKS